MEPWYLIGFLLWVLFWVWLQFYPQTQVYLELLKEFFRKVKG